MPPKKPAKKPAAKAEATFKPLPEATPRYVAPVAASAAPKAMAAPADNDWDLSLQFWWAQFWRTLLVVIPCTITLQLLLALLFALLGVGPSEIREVLIMGLTLALSVALQVAVVRHMLRKKTFKGFTFTLKGRE